MQKHFFVIRFLDKIVNITKHLKCLSLITTFLNDSRHKLTFHNIYPFLYKSYNTCILLNKYSKFSNIIWFFWLQGPNHMPIIVNKCWESLKRHKNGCKLVFIDKNNVRYYSTLPKYIYKKVRDGYITFTEFSDILRCNLLKNYGGIWSDASNYITGNMNVDYFNKNELLITSGVPTKYDYYICTKWAVGLIGSKTFNNPLFVFMNSFFLNYWKNNDYLISYNLIDYALYFGYKNNIGNFQYYVDNETPKNNPNMFKLKKYMNNAYDPKIWHNLNSNTHVFNITYKGNYVNTGNNFYHKLINSKL